MVNYSTAQQVALALLPKISGTLSCLFSFLVVVTILRTDRPTSFRAYHRLVLGISVSDMSSSFSLALSTWPIPRDLGVLWASGNSNTCSAQGFMNHLGLIATFYNVSLNIYFLLVIRYGWKDKTIIFVEPFLHALPILWGFSTAIYAAIKGLYGNVLLWCWIAPVYDKERWVLYYGPLTLNIAAMIITSLLIYLHVRTVEKRSRTYRFQRYQTNDLENVNSRPRPDITLTEESGDRTILNEISCPTSEIAQSQNIMNKVQPQQKHSKVNHKNKESGNKHTRTVARRCFWFAVGFFLNWTPLYVTRLLQTITGRVYYPLLLAAAATIPLQGIPNGFVYLYPKYQALREKHKDWTRTRTIWAVLSGSKSNMLPSSNSNQSMR